MSLSNALSNAVSEIVAASRGTKQVAFAVIATTAAAITATVRRTPAARPHLCMASV